jgi:hypothetical protein
VSWGFNGGREASRSEWWRESEENGEKKEKGEGDDEGRESPREDWKRV